MTHNFSTHQLNTHAIQLLTKGLSFTPTPTTPIHATHQHLHKQFNEFAKSLILKVTSQVHISPTAPTRQESPKSSVISRKMNFTPQKTNFSSARHSGFPLLESYIYNTKEQLDQELENMCIPFGDNLTTHQRKALTTFQRQRSTITIKPADKNLGVVIMDTDDYICQCTEILRDKQTYRLTTYYPFTEIKEAIENTCARFKDHLKHIRKDLHDVLIPTTKNQAPKLYGIPKVHKSFTRIPPMRLIISQSNSPLQPSAKFIDHVLQPLSQSYPDYIQNSSSLIKILDNMSIPANAILVTIDVTNLYPSVPQSECLQIIYEEMFKKRHLLLADPYLIIQLLQTNINYNYFAFASLYFQQIHGTAMGAAFSPTVANIFMSVTLSRFLRTQPIQPILLARYIDDLFILWPERETVDAFLSELNSFHPNLKFTHVQSESTIDFLDLTIYKGPHFPNTNKLNLYQYLEYTSTHPKSVFKSIIIGECKRYLRSNTRPETYEAVITTFKKY